jgi:TP901 family phage tail tape measure protein
MDIRVNGSANLKQVKAEFAALEAQVAGLNTSLAETAAASSKINPAGFQKLTGAVESGSKAYRNALSSTGAFRVEQMRLNSATSHYTDLLQKQKLSFKDMRKNAAAMQAAYKEQLAMQDMVIRKAEVASKGGKQLWDVGLPRQYRQELDNVGNKLGWLGAKWKSGGTQMVNFGKNTQWAGRQLSVGFTLPLVAAGAAAGVLAFQIDQQLTRVKKVYDTTADQTSHALEDMKAVQAEFAKLSADSWKTASNAASQYGSAAKDTMGVEAELAATGMKGAKLQAATTEVMKNAMLGEIDYQTATQATIALQQQLHLSTKDLGDSWAYMNSVENATSLQMKDFAQSIPIALGPLKLMGGSLQDLGTLMTAMVSRGVQVGKAANSIKALPTRLSNPSKKVQEDFRKMTGQDIVEMNKKNKNNIIGLLTDIENATKNLDKVAKRKTLAGLFGTFQLAPMYAMLQGMDDLQKGTGQVTKAFDIGQQSVKQWRQVSEQEIGQMQKSVSGRFKIMVETFKIQLAEMGKPFLEVATIVGNALTSIISAFNKLPKAVKVLTAIPILFAAIAGPVLMLVGLFYNLSGNARRALGSLASFASALVVTTKEEKAATLAMQQEQAAMGTLARQTEALRFQKELLAGATNEAQKASMAFMLAQQGVAQSELEALMGTETLAKAEMKLSEQYLLEAERLDALAVARREANAQAVAQGKTLPPALQQYPAKQEANAIVYRDMAAQAAAKEAEEMSKASKVSKETAIATEKTSKSMAGAAMSGAAFAGGMALTMTNSNKTMNTIGNILMMSAIIVPSFKMMGVAMKEVTGKATEAAKAAKGMAASAGAFTSEMFASIGPVGWVLAALTAGAVLSYKIYKNEMNRRNEIEKQNQSLKNQNNLMADALNIKPNTKKNVLPAMQPAKGMDLTASSLADQMQHSASVKPLIGLVKGANETKQATIAAEKYMQVLNSTGGTAEKAQTYVEALFLAAGQDAETASNKAIDAYNAIGTSIENNDVFGLWKQKLDDALVNTEKFNLWHTLTTGRMTTSDSSKIMSDGEDIGAQMVNSIATGMMSAADAMNGAENTLQTKWTSVWVNVSDKTKTMLAKSGIDSVKEFQAAMQDATGRGATGDPLTDTMNGFNVSASKANEIIKAMETALTANDGKAGRLLATEDGIVKTLQTQWHLGNDLKSLAQIRASFEFKLLTATKAQALELYKQRIASLAMTGAAQKWLGITQKSVDTDKLATANYILRTLHMGQAKTLEEAIAMLSGKTANNIADGAKNAKNLAGALKGVPHYLDVAVRLQTKEQAVGVLKAGMEGVTNDLAQRASDTFQNKMDASLAASQAGWDRKIQANDDKAQRQQDKLDARWTRRKDAMNAYYQKRSDNIDKAIKTEQDAEAIREKIFEAEKTRIERLNQMANNNIDFNTALNQGKLDEAAKLRNDAQATMAQWSLGDTGDKTKASSDAKVQRLNDQKDELQKAQQAAEKAMQKREDAEKKHLDRIQKRRSEALKRQEDASMAAQKKMWDNEKTSLDGRLELFKSYIGRNKKDIERWMKVVGLSYDDFGIKVKGKGETWSTWFQKSMVKHMQVAGSAVASDNMWANVGKQSLAKMLKAMGFKNMNEYARFIATGSLPANFGNRSLTSTAAPKKKGKPGSKNLGTSTLHGTEIHHVGGEIGSGGTNRRGVARSLKGIHSSEKLVVARKGEYMVNEKSAQSNLGLLHAINSSRGSIAKMAHTSHGSRTQQDDFAPITKGNRNEGRGAGPIAGPAPLLGGLVKSMSTAIANGMTKQFNQKMAAVSNPVGGSFGIGKAGQFADMSFSKEQLTNAATIANVGSKMGMSKRDIEIGIMTAIDESGLRNLHYGDRDSEGLFQQRPSQGWGTPEQVTTPTYAARKFFEALKGIHGRDSMAPWMAAQAVQRSGTKDGSNYRQFWDNAIAIYNKGLVKKNDSFGVASGFLGGGGAANAIGRRAVQWATGQLGHAGWLNLCQKFVRMALGAPGAASGSTAIGAWGAARFKHRGDRNPPVGTPVYFSGGSAGHAALSTGHGNIISTDWPHGNTVGRTNISSIERHWGKHYLGWTEDINGKKIYNLNKGGYTTSDGVAMLHKNELVLDASRTKSLQDSIDRFNTNGVAFGSLNEGIGAGRRTLPKHHKRHKKHPAHAKNAKPKKVPTKKPPAKPGPSYGASTPAPIGSRSAGGVSRLSGLGDQELLSTGAPAARAAGRITAGGLGADSKVATKIGTGSYNMFSRSGPGTVSVIRKMMSRVGVIALQEYQGKKMHQGLAEMLAKNGWGFYHSFMDTALAWNKKKYGASNLGSYSLNPKHFGKAGLMHRYATYGLFTDKKTGRQFWQVSVHTAPKGDGHHPVGSPAQRAAVLKEQGDSMESLYKQLRGTGRPVFISGDMAKAAQARVTNAYSSRGKRNVFQTLSQYKASSAGSMAGSPSDHAAWLSYYNIPGLRKGAMNVRYDNTLANLHKGESVLTADYNNLFKKGIQNFATGGGNEYNYHVYPSAGMDEKGLAKEVMRLQKRHEDRKARSIRG